MERAGGYVRNRWAVLSGIVKIAIAYAVLSAASSRFETIVFAILVLIYVAVETSYAEQLCTSVAIAMKTHGSSSAYIRRLTLTNHCCPVKSQTESVG
jgi:hypothetical protein